MLIAAALLAYPTLAFAQGDEDTEEGSDTTDSKKKTKGRTEDPGGIREIVRGVYAKAGVGAAGYLGDFGPFVSTGTYVGLAVGQDFVDNEKQSMAWEIGLHQGLHNGVPGAVAVGSQAELGCYTTGTGSAPCTQGDLRTYSLTANYEISFYPTRRLGIGARLGAGVLYSPLFIEAEAYQKDFIPAFGGVDPGLHNSPKPLFFGGPTIEYYTKLSHFSVGVDFDVFYGLGWDLGFNGSGSLKYTF